MAKSLVEYTWEQLSSYEREVLSSLRPVPFDPKQMEERFLHASTYRKATDCISLVLYLTGVSATEQWLAPYCTSWILPMYELIDEIPLYRYKGTIPIDATVVSLRESNRLRHWYHTAVVLSAEKTELIHRPGDNKPVQEVLLEDMLVKYDSIAQGDVIQFYRHRD